MKTDRNMCSSLEDRIMSVESAAMLIKSGMTICVSGFSQDYPKAIPQAIARLGKAENLTVISGATGGDRLVGVLTNSGQLSRFSAFQSSKELRNSINSGKIEFIDCHLSQLADKLESGYFGQIDFAIIECCKINADGGIVPSLSGGIVSTIINCSKKVLLEINTNFPLETEGFHDFEHDTRAPIRGIMDKVGEPVIRCSPDKIAGIVITDEPILSRGFPESNELYGKIASNIVSLLQSEIGQNQLPQDFTFQSGMGVVANSVIMGLAEHGFKGLKMYTELLSQAALDAVQAGVISCAATNALDLDRQGYDNLFSNIDFFKEHIVIRPLKTINSSAQIMAQNLVAMNTAVEVDIYGNVNSTHVMGTRMLNGIGGSNDFCRNAKLSIFSTPSVAKNGAISCIVPMVSHVDSTEHETDIIVTEVGYADLRGKSPKERAREIIENCAHPDYRQQLWDYYESAIRESGPCQTPHDLKKALSWHQRYIETGNMHV